MCSGSATNHPVKMMTAGPTAMALCPPLDLTGKGRMAYGPRFDSLNSLEGNLAAEIWKTIDTWPGRRSGDMIVITVILSALCGVITIGFLSTVCYECFKLWRHGPPENQEEQAPEAFQGSHYDTHHIPPAPPVPPPPPPAADMPGPHLTP
ncbi:Uroplakin-3b, partial [Ophiophagus hannah]